MPHERGRSNQRRPEGDLHHSEKKYRLLLETINEAVFEVDAEGHVVYISAGVRRILGYLPEELMGRAFIDFVYEKDRDRLLNRFSELATGVVRSSEYRVVRKSGEAHWVETFSRPRIDGTRFMGLVGVMTDIHQRKLIEAESERRKQLLEATLNSTADGIVALDQKGRILTWNRRFATMWRLSESQLRQLQSREELEAITARQLPRAPGRSAAGLFDHMEIETRREIATEDGRVFEVVSCPLSSDESDGGMVWNFRDITAAKRTEAALARSEEKFSKLFHASPIWSELVSLDDGRFIEVNQTFLDTTGFEREAVIGRTSTAVGLWPEGVDRTDIVAHFQNHHRLDALPCEFRMRDGQHRHFLWSAEAVVLDGKRCLISSLLDVTEQHHMEDALRKSEERFRSLYNNIPLGLFRTTPEGRILSANPALAVLLGFDAPEEVLNMSSANFYARADDRRQMIADLEREGSVSREAILFRRRDGSTFWASLSAARIADQDNAFIYLDGVLQDVSERIRAEDALRASEEKYRLLVDNAHDGIFISRNGRILFSNPSTCRILGYTHAEMMAMPLDRLVHPEDVGLIMARHMDRLSGQDPPSHYTFRALCKTGATLFLELQAVRVDWEEQPAILCIVRDITARQLAEEKLQEEKRFSESVINSLPGVFYLYDEGARLCRWNRNMEKLSGLSPEQLGRMQLSDWFAPEDRQLAADAFLAVLESGEVQTEIPVRAPNGRKRPYYFNGYKMSIEGRSYLLGVGLDVSRQKRLQAALRESEKRFRHLVEKMPFGISIAVDRQIIYRNPAQERLLGPQGERAALEDAPLPAEDLKRYLTACRYAEKEAKPVEALELRFISGQPDDVRHGTWMHCSLHPIEYRGRKALMIAMVDLTRIKELEQQVLIREKMASLGHVAAGIAHEIRNPLSGINVLLEGIRENYEDPDAAEDIRALLDESQKASDKIARVIRRVLDFAKPSAVKMTLCDIRKPVVEAIDLTQVTLRKSGIGIDCRLTPGLPLLYIDPLLVEQVILNLINNAVAAVAHSDGEKRILIINRREANHLSICVADSGCGVSDSLKTKIFEPYFTTRNDGSGIGLSLCQRIASDHGGTIEVGRSEELGGAEFRLRLPLEKRKHPR
jgi:PAS domain S-box-containing protein